MELNVVIKELQDGHRIYFLCGKAFCENDFQKKKNQTNGNYKNSTESRNRIKENIFTTR